MLYGHRCRYALAGCIVGLRPALRSGDHARAVDVQGAYKACGTRFTGA